MTRLCRGFVLVVLSACVMQAEWFDKGKVRYKTLDGKWRKAAVHVTDDGIEVYDRKHRSLVATFASLDPKINEDLSVPMRRGAVAYGLLSGAVIAGYLAVSEEPGYVTDCFYADYSSSCTSYWSEGRDAVITAGAAWKAIGVMSAVAAVIAAIPARPTEYTFTDGPRSITVRVGKKNQQRFTNALSIRAASSGHRVNRAATWRMLQTPTSLAGEVSNSHEADQDNWKVGKDILPMDCLMAAVEGSPVQNR